jgi:hypothetical protein
MSVIPVAAESARPGGLAGLGISAVRAAVYLALLVAVYLVRAPVYPLERWH